MPHANDTSQNTINYTQAPCYPLMSTSPFWDQTYSTHFQYFSMSHLHKRRWRISGYHSSTTMRQQLSDKYATPRQRKIRKNKWGNSSPSTHRTPLKHLIPKKPQAPIPQATNIPLPSKCQTGKSSHQRTHHSCLTQTYRFKHDKHIFFQISWSPCCPLGHYASMAVKPPSTTSQSTSRTSIVEIPPWG